MGAGTRLECEASLSAELVEIIGLVDPFGSGGGSARGGPWVFRFTFACWRDADGVFHPESLRVEQEVPRGDLAGLMKKIQRCAIVRLRVMLGSDGTAQLDAIVDVNAGDSQLQARRAELTQPVTHSDAQFGLLTLEPRLRSWFCGEVEWQGSPVKLTFHAADVAELDGTLATARRLWSDQAGWDARRRACLLGDLFSLKNDAWLGESDAAVTEQEFLSRASLETVSVRADGRLQFWHDDGDLFWGHAIEVSGSIDVGELNANIAG